MSSPAIPARLEVLYLKITREDLKRIHKAMEDKKCSSCGTSAYEILEAKRVKPTYLKWKAKFDCDCASRLGLSIDE